MILTCMSIQSLAILVPNELKQCFTVLMCDLLQALLMEEQKEILAQLHSERRQLAEERAHFMVSQQLKADQEKRDQIKNTRVSI